MIVGETIRLTLTEQRPDAFLITSASLTALNPDGTAYSPSITVRLEEPAGDETETTWLLRANLTPSQGGEYRLTWSYVDDAGETILRPGRAFALWTDAFSFIRTRLQVGADELPGDVLEPEFASVARKLLSRYPGVGYPLGQVGTVQGQYNGLFGSDQDWFDEAAALLVCARLVGPLSTGGGTSDQIQRKEGDAEYRFAETGRYRQQEKDEAGLYAGQNERVRFVREAVEALGRVSTIQALHSARAASLRPFTINGPTRTAKAAGNVETLTSSVIRLLTDDWTAEQDYFNRCPINL